MKDETQQRKVCPNCGGGIQPEDVFCRRCGQKVPRKMPTLGDLLGEFFSNFLNFDSRFFRTARDIFIPGRLTKLFFQGVRKSYYAPFRLLIFSSFLFFATFSLTKFHKNIQEAIKVGTPTKEYLQKVVAMDRIDSARVSVVEKFAEDQRPQVIETIDSLKAVILQGGFSGGDSINFVLAGKKRWTFLMRDVLLLSPEELVEKYHVDRFWDRVAVRQMSKTIQNPSVFVFTLIGNVFWLLMALIPLMALVLKLLYWKQGRYYIEHLVFLLHEHAFLFIWATIMLGLLALSPAFFRWGVLLASLYFFLSLWRYYGQNLWKTILKWFVFVSLYVILGLILFAGVTLVSFMVF